MILHRCGVAGFKTNLLRSLLTQITSHGRHVSANFSNTTLSTSTIADPAPAAKCEGCGSPLQSNDSILHGYVPEERHHQSLTENASLSNIICQRCINLKHHNTVLPPGQASACISKYSEFMQSFSTEKALILVVVDAIDFPGSQFPSLDAAVGSNTNRPVHIVANKIDLLPDTTTRTLHRLERYIRAESLKGMNEEFNISKMWFTSSKTGQGVRGLCDWIIRSWGNRGDVYLLGCTNVGKSSLFHKLMVHLCGSLPGDRETISGLPAPSPVVSNWPGTTLDLISFPILSFGKRRRLLSQINKTVPASHKVFEESEGKRIRDLALAKNKRKSLAPSNPGVYDCLPDIEEVLTDIGLKRKPDITPVDSSTRNENEQVPMNRRWLHDTPGATIDTRLINFLTTKELQLFLPKQPLRPRTFILKPGSTLFIGGLARLDYHEGTVSAYFTVYCSSYIPLHTTLTHKADSLYERNLGKPLFKIPFGDQTRIDQFPRLQPQSFIINGCGLNQCSSDIILSSIGWVSVTLGNEHTATVNTFMANGKGVWLRDPALVPEGIKERGRRSRKGNRTAFMGKK